MLPHFQRLDDAYFTQVVLATDKEGKLAMSYYVVSIILIAKWDKGGMRKNDYRLYSFTRSSNAQCVGTQITEPGSLGPN